MTPAQLQTIEEIFHSALDRPPDEIGLFLDASCEGDKLLRAELEALLAARQQAGHFIETPAVGLAAKVFENAQPDPRIGLRVGHYELCERIGAGGMGEVYLAIDMTAGRKAALKFLPRRYTGDPERLRRFQQEARAVARINHPNIVTAYEVGEHDSSYFIASELIDGETLRQRLLRGRIELEEAINIVTQIATALASAHEAGIIHRDIKPENIMLRRDGYVKLLDFGIAKLAQQELVGAKFEQEPVLSTQTHVGSIVGTARYMSPEQARGEPVGHFSDIWSLGVVLYEILTGHVPFGGSTPEEVKTAILEREPSTLTSHRAELSSDIQEIVARTLRKDCLERYQSASELTQALRQAQRRIELRSESVAVSASHAWLSWTRLAASLAVLLLALSFALVTYFSRKARSGLALAEKSIAVLPFENLSDNKGDSYFVAGVQDEILTDLARIADLKVISRNSTRPYRPGKPRNSRQIGEQLGVAHLLEGSVQRSNNRLRINAQLIDARSDSHLWAQTYDREVEDLFAIQTEIAQTIATQLQARISPREKAAIARMPTSDVVANDLYQQAKALRDQSSETKTLTREADLLERAIARDARFLPAYCALALVHTELFTSNGQGKAHLQVAQANIRKAFQLQPDSSEAHLAQAHYLARGLRDYDGARAELELARRGLPNDPQVYFETARMDYRQGRWAEALRNHDRAIELDPRNLLLLSNAVAGYSEAHCYPKALQVGRRALALSPHDKCMRLFVASLPLEERADLRPLRAELSSILAEEPGAMADICCSALDCAIFEHDAAAADRALAAIPPEGFRGLMGFVVPREWFVGYTALIFNRAEAGYPALLTARARLEKRLRDQPDDAMSWGLLGRTKAMLGEKQEAIEAGQHACELWPLTREGRWGLTPLRQLTKIYAYVGDKDRALQLLSQYAGQPSFIHYGELKLAPDWDPLRGDPRFEKVVASLAPKEELSK